MFCLIGLANVLLLRWPFCLAVLITNSDVVTCTGMLFFSITGTICFFDCTIRSHLSLSRAHLLATSFIVILALKQSLLLEKIVLTKHVYSWCQDISLDKTFSRTHIAKFCGQLKLSRAIRRAFIFFLFESFVRVLHYPILTSFEETPTWMYTQF